MPAKQGQSASRMVVDFGLGGPSGVADTTTTYTAPILEQEGDGLLFWSSGPLDVAYHSLRVNVTSASADSPFAIDYLVYTIQQTSPNQPDKPFSIPDSPSSTTSLSAGLSLTPLPPSSLSTPSPGSGSSTSSGGSPGATGAPGTDPGRAGGSNGASTSSHSSHTGAIVGGVVGGVVFLAAVLVCFLWWRRSERKAGYKSNPGSFVSSFGVLPSIKMSQSQQNRGPSLTKTMRALLTSPHSHYHRTTVKPRAQSPARQRRCQRWQAL